MKVYRKIVINSCGEILYEDSEIYYGEVAACKGGSSTTQTQPLEEQKPYLQDIWSKAQGQYQTPLGYYSGTKVAGFTPEQQMAQEWTTQRALAGSPLLGGAQQGVYNTMGGQYLSPESNLWLAETYKVGAQNLGQQYGEITMPELRRSAMGAGAYGGSRQGVSEGIASRGLAQGLSSLATGIYGPAYEAERGRQMQAYQMAPGLAEADYTDIGKLAAVGEEKQAMSQSLIDEMVKQYEYSQLEPWQRLGMYSNLITGDVDGTTMSSRSGK